MAAEHRQRCLVDPLGVLQVAWGVVRDIPFDRCAGARSTLGQEFAHIAHPRRKGGGCPGIEQMAIVLEQRPAAGAVDHDELGGVEGRDVGPGQRGRALVIAGVSMERTAA